jgi:HPt (histidine-containing phosphotransfer) domain-containing protein
MDTSVIDPSTFDELRDAVGTEFLIELVDTFLDEAPSILGQLRTALAASDTVGYRRAAHSLKSNCNTFGALSLGLMARDAELDGFCGDANIDNGVVDTIEAAFAIVAVELKQRARG